uniref:Ig-like domain-containing protein n=1 Tax=Naja naja TaxID=35670 RepID=A0A8C6XFL3_NAJNA
MIFLPLKVIFCQDWEAEMLSPFLQPLDREAEQMFTNKEKVQKDFKAVPSEDVSLSCEVAQAKADVKWFKDGKLITSSKKFKVEAEGRSRHLVIQQVEKKDGGEYTCEVGGQKLTFKVAVAGGNTVIFSFTSF